jgi:hypothetical protein
MLKQMIVGGLLAAGCWRDGPARPVTPAPPPVQQQQQPDDPCAALTQRLKTFESFALDVCTCTDKACADAVGERMRIWSEDMARAATSVPIECHQNNDAGLTEAAMKYSDCYTRLMTTGTPP